MFPSEAVFENVTNITNILFRTNVASVGSVFNDTRKVKVLSLPETIKEKSTFRAKALRRELIVHWTTNSRRRAFARNVDFSFIVSGSETTFTFRVMYYLLYNYWIQFSMHKFEVIHSNVGKPVASYKHWHLWKRNFQAFFEWCPQRQRFWYYIANNVINCASCGLQATEFGRAIEVHIYITFISVLTVYFTHYLLSYILALPCNNFGTRISFIEC